MRIPLPKIMRHWREKAYDTHVTPPMQRAGLEVWAWFARRPWAYRLGARLGMAILGAMGRRKGRFATLPLAGGWTKGRDMPAPAGRTFLDLWRAREQERH